MSNIERAEIYDGKYTVVIEDGHKVSVLRHGKPWRGNDEFVGDGLILAMASQLVDQGWHTDDYPDNDHAVIAITTEGTLTFAEWHETYWWDGMKRINITKWMRYPT